MVQFQQASFTAPVRHRHLSMQAVQPGRFRTHHKKKKHLHKRQRLRPQEPPDTVDRERGSSTLTTARTLKPLVCYRHQRPREFALLPAPKSTPILNAYFNGARRTNPPQRGGAGAAPRGITSVWFPCAPDFRSRGKQGRQAPHQVG